MVSDGGADEGRSAAQPEERKTETTLTTRIRINIPGSRPIPPVVVRQPVADAGSSEDTGETEAPAVIASTAAAEPPAEPAASAAEEKTSDWFAPRKSSGGKGGQGGGSTNGAGLPGASGTAAGAGPGAGSGAGGARPNTGRPGGVVGSMSAPGGSRPGGQNGARPGATNGAGLPGATGGPVAPGHGGGTGSFDVTEALAAGPLGGGSRSEEPRRDDLPYFSEGGDGGQSGQSTQNGQNGYGGPDSYGGQGGSSGYDGPNGHGGAQGPAGPTGGPVTGDGPLVPPVGGGPDGPVGPGAAPGSGTFSDPGGGTFSGPGPGGGPGGGTFSGPGPGNDPGGGMSDDTAILTPQKPALEPPAPNYGSPDNVSGHTVTSGIPVVPSGQNSPFGPGAHAEAPVRHTAPKLPEPPSAQKASGGGSARKPKKKGRNKLALLGGGAVFIAAGAYGAGLLMNHSDVPKGTTVLGVDIGGGTRDDAVKKLDEAFGDQVDKSLKLSVDGDTVALRPDQAGLQFDTQATVRAAAESDYNPVSVIGSLFGNHRVVDPVMPVDEEKLRSALETAAGGSGSATEGTIKFQSGKAVAVYGKVGKGIDVAKSTEAVEEAYREQVENGTASAVTVPTTTRKPTVSNAEVDREMKAFAQPAMSGLVTVKTDTGVQVAFSPQNSLWKFLQVKPVNGKLVDSYDKAALKKLYGGAFDDVLITRATGKKTAVTVEDVIGALRPALLSKTNRVGIIDTNPN